jgi:signal transduction histidine kinase/ligand-binding sensor domain-containing protein
MSCRWLMLAALLTADATGHASEADAAWLVRVWKVTEGLAGTNVSGVVQTADGFIWVVAGGELARFDGTQFTPVPGTAFGGARGTRIREFVATADGGFAFAMFDGALIRANGNKFQVAAGILPHEQVRLEALSEDGAGGFLVVYNDESVWRVRGNKVTRLTDDDGLPPGAHCRFTRDLRGRIWFAKGDYIGLMQGDRFEVLQQFPASSFVRIGAAGDGGVWIGAASRLLHFDLGAPLKEVARIPVTDIPVRPTFLLEDHGGVVWFGTYASGLFRFDGARVESVPISHRQVVSLTEDREGSLWVATSGGGLNQVQPRAITIEGGEIGVPYQAVQTVVEDEHGQLWGLTQNGLVVARRDGEWQRIDGIKTDGEASCIAVEPGGALWIGTKTGSLHRWSDGALATWGPADGIVTTRFQSLLFSKRGDLWLGGARPASLQRFRAGKLQTFALPHPADTIRAMTEDTAGQIWVGVTGRQLVRIGDDDRVIDESSRIAPVGKNVRLLQAAPDGSVWLSCDQSGIARLKDGVLRRVTTHEGFLYDHIELMLPDGRGWWWFAANEAIFKVSEQSLVAVLDGRAKQVQPVRYGREQGIRPLFGGTGGAVRRQDGRLWIPMATALAIIDPSHERPVADPPPVWITDVKVDDQIVGTHGGPLAVRPAPPIERNVLTLKPDHHRLDIAFAALSFRTPLNNTFRYRLDPFEDHWIDAAAGHSVSYSRLPAGDYQFRVKACNGDGVWNEAGATFAFIVQPFFWETWWFRATVLVVFTAIVFAIARYVSFRRLHLKLRAAEQGMAVERERARIARDIHDDLGSRLTKIMLLSALIKRDRVAPEKAGTRIDEISETAQQAVRSLDETVWAVDPRNDNLPEIISYLAQSAESFLRTAEIECELDLPVAPSPEHVSTPEFRHELFLAVKEALTNVIRHAHATKVSLRIALGVGTLEIVVSDNGRGITGPVNDAHADGLRNMRQRMQQIGGEFRVESLPGEGTRIFLIAPWPPRG